jgi:hypothetical protein
MKLATNRIVNKILVREAGNTFFSPQKFSCRLTNKIVRRVNGENDTQHGLVCGNFLQ